MAKKRDDIVEEPVVQPVSVPTPVSVIVHPGKCPTCGRDLCGERQ